MLPLSGKHEGNMNRLLWVVAAVALSGGMVSAGEPPAGKERTLVEQEFFLPEQPRPARTFSSVSNRMPTPTEPRSFVADVRGWLIHTVAGQLGVSPVVQVEVW